jgi:RimJ/RimL family protein N-acetyltransferase
LSGETMTSNGVPVEIRPFIGAEADEAELRAWHELYTAERRREFPGFPLQPYEQFAARARSPRWGDLGPRHAWIAFEGGRLIGSGTVLYPDEHLLDWAVVRVLVGDSHRRRGVGTALLREIVADAREQGRVTLANDQVRFGSAGERWARAVGFSSTQRNRWAMLHVRDADPVRWEVPAPSGFQLARWEGAAPEELVVAFAAARNAIADAPTGDSSYEHRAWTVERVRQAESEVRESGDLPRVVVAVHEGSGAVAALTGLRLRPGRTDLSWQGDTAVVQGFRGRGLGRAVKAAMMRWVLADLPDLERVVTNTAADNASMIRVNEQIGYVHYADIGVFEGSVEQVNAALEMSAAIPGPRRESASEGEPVG